LVKRRKKRTEGKEGKWLQKALLVTRLGREKDDGFGHVLSAWRRTSVYKKEEKNKKKKRRKNRYKKKKEANYEGEATEIGVPAGKKKPAPVVKIPE